MKTAPMFLLNAEMYIVFSHFLCLSLSLSVFVFAVVIQNKVMHHKTDESKMKQ